MLELANFVVQRGQFSTAPVSFQLKPGRLIHVRGRNGSGKTTLLDGIGGFAKAIGQITWEGTNIASWGPEQRHRVIFARHFQNPRWNIKAADLLSASGYDMKQLTRDEKFTMVGETVADIPKDMPLDQLSFGQSRRIMLASAILRNQPILLLDEPLEGIDMENARRIEKAIEALLANGTAAIMVEHLPSTWNILGKQFEVTLA